MDKSDSNMSFFDVSQIEIYIAEWLIVVHYIGTILTVLVNINYLDKNYCYYQSMRTKL